MNKQINSFAEVVESSVNSFTAQCWKWDNFPNFGSLILVEEKEKTLLGLVTNISTGSLDANRYPFTYQKTLEELQEEQPQIFEFLKTTFKVLVVGYIENSKIRYLLPPTPAKIHSFVSFPSKKVINDFFSSFDFLHLIFSNEAVIINIDELLLALLHYLSNEGLLNELKLIEFSDRLSLLTGNDYRRLKLFLYRAQQLINL